MSACLQQTRFGNKHRRSCGRVRNRHWWKKVERAGEGEREREDQRRKHKVPFLLRLSNMRTDWHMFTCWQHRGVSANNASLLSAKLLILRCSRHEDDWGQKRSRCPQSHWLIRWYIHKTILCTQMHRTQKQQRSVPVAAPTGKEAFFGELWSAPSPQFFACSYGLAATVALGIHEPGRANHGQTSMLLYSAWWGLQWQAECRERRTKHLVTHCTVPMLSIYGNQLITLGTRYDGG